ncbi:hypothetical protein CPB83DRAFT_893410 [Crepidotus variabilis]|uniref:Calpain catalytic domain-containing protein n=1 Tax=Crepidotus variabilis TaxID=179855 RepID=A0A9P6JQV0_9AGAR|nr:hypothetical protein CPB83DRAFT_893410 [Crepidotus variabilis]
MLALSVTLKARHFRNKIQAHAAATKVSTLTQPKPGLLVTKQLDDAIADCKAHVAKISKDCQVRNIEFRDIEFDLEIDTTRCLYGLAEAESNKLGHWTDGVLRDHWFLSVLATVASAPGLVVKFCVHDNIWVSVIIDDLLYRVVPKWEELHFAEQQLYHGDKDAYNKSARQGGKSLYFAKSGTAGETWVPLIEKAYAKLHGNCSHLDGGQT